jgi:hypothetical protein
MKRVHIKALAAFHLGNIVPLALQCDLDFDGRSLDIKSLNLALRDAVLHSAWKGALHETFVFDGRLSISSSGQAICFTGEIEPLSESERQVLRGACADDGTSWVYAALVGGAEISLNFTAAQTPMAAA